MTKTEWLNFLKLKSDRQFVELSGDLEFQEEGDHSDPWYKNHGYEDEYPESDEFRVYSE